MSNISDDIKVSLSSTKFVKESDLSEALETRFWKENLPVCSAEYTISVLLHNPEKFQEDVSKNLTSFVKTLFIDTENKIVLIGQNPLEILDNRLVEYKISKEPNKFEKEFFHRWNELQTLFFEYSIYNNFKLITSIVGYWKDNEWKRVISRRSKAFSIDVRKDGTI